jgi:hypothetical protein
MEIGGFQGGIFKDSWLLLLLLQTEHNAFLVGKLPHFGGSRN